MLDALRHHFRPEFLNRVDEIIVFHALSKADLKKIIDIQLGRLLTRLSERRITLKLSDAARDHLAEAGYDPVYGARPLKRAIQREVETPLSRAILRGDVKDNSVVLADLVDGRIAFKPEPLAESAGSGQ